MSATLSLDESTLRAVIDSVLRELGPPPARTEPAAAPARPAAPAARSGTGLGVFADASAACAAADEGFRQLQRSGIAARVRIIEIVKKLCADHAAEWGRDEFAETRIGRLEHKIEKLQIVKLVPGVEWLRPYALSGDLGLTLEEYTPFGVVGAITPVTHSVPTLAGNIINIVAAGNAVVFNPHPSGARCAAAAVRAFNEAIRADLGLENVICTIESPSLDSFDAIAKSDFVRLLCVTGGPAVVQAAMKSGKRAICAGPGNPPVVVDGTRCLKRAAADIVRGAAYDNNLLCIGEKQVFVLDAVADSFVAALRDAGGAPLTAGQFDRLTGAAFTRAPGAGGCSHPVLNRALVGRDAAVLARESGASVPEATPLLFAEAPADHPFVLEEQMMPVLPVVRVRSFEDALAGALRSEHGYRHSAIIHSANIDRVAEMARLMDTTLFVTNGPSVAGLGLGGEGYLSYSIATTTGEGITTPRTFTRTRRSVRVETLRNS